MKIPGHLNPTIVTANGEILHTGKPNDGLVVVDGGTHKPVISFDEVTGDRDVVHVFVKFAEGAVFGRLPQEDDEPVHESVGSGTVHNTHEILISRKEHKGLEKGR